MSDTTTSPLGFVKPEVGASNNTWGDKLNADLDALDDALEAVAAAVAVVAGNLTTAAGVAAAATAAVDAKFSPAAKTVMVAADEFLIRDSAASGAPKAVTRTNAFTNPMITSPSFKYTNKGSGSGARAVDVSVSSYQRNQVSGATTFTFTNPPASEAFGFILELVNGGSFALTWPASVKWPGGSPPAFTASGTDLCVFLTRDGGATWFGNIAMTDVQ
jgi:hypothetical protein